MIKNREKDKIDRQTEKRILWLRFKNGCRNLKTGSWQKYLLIGYVLFIFLTWISDRKQPDWNNIPLISPVFPALWGLLYPFLLVGGSIILLILFGTPHGAGQITNDFRRIGLVNHAGETPFLLIRSKDEKHPEAAILEFDGAGIPIKEWEDRQQRIEAALNVHIVKIQEGNDKRTIRLHTVPARGGLSDKNEWRDSYLIKDSSTLVLGRSLLGNVTVDLAKIPHILLGGSTGSGKSVLLKLLLMQAVKKGAVVSIADFKGGVDFSSVWHERCRMCFDEDRLIELLTELVEELERRKVLFREQGCPNLDEYNRQTGACLPRYIFACDEAAEILDKNGLSKEQKEKVSLIENRLSVIARQGRAFGIHLILATQRPDANILSGQIRNNMDCRICGRADNVLSQIILDSTAAAEQIPKDTAGRFLLYDGTVFQAFWWEENDF